MAAEDLAARSKQRVAELEATLGESKQLGAKLEAMLENGGAAPKVLTGSAKASHAQGSAGCCWLLCPSALALACCLESRCQPRWLATLCV